MNGVTALRTPGASSSTAQALTASTPVGSGLHAAAPADLERSFEHCRAVVRERARNFYYGLRLTPEPKRSAIYAIYAWSRAADDGADDSAPLAQRRARLASFRAATERVLAGGAALGEAPFWPAFAHVVRTYRLDPDCFLDMLAGQDEDLEHRGYETDAELGRYCYRVASTVGLVCVSIWGIRAGVDPSVARELSIKRGQAFQRTNILRDLAEDYDERPSRLYLPRAELARFGLTPSELRAWSRPEACRALVLHEARLARSYYESSAPLEDMIEPSCRPTLWAMTRIYEGILRQIEATPELVVAPIRAGLSRRRKLAIALTATVRARAAR